MRIQARLEGVDLSLVCYKTNGYSLPTVFGNQCSLVKGYIERAGIIGYGAEVIARHNRSCEKADFIYDSLRYLALLESGAGALDQAAPLDHWSPPECFGRLRRQMKTLIAK